MKRMFNLMLVGCVCGLMVTGCGGDTDSDKKDTKTTETVEVSEESEPAEMIEDDEVIKDPIKIEDIDWSVEEGIVRGDRFIIFSYTNNTKYPIVDVEMKFTQKEDVTPEQRAVLNSLKENSFWDDDDIIEAYINGYNRKLVDPGEASDGSPCCFNGTYTYVENMDQYELMEPDTVGIVYLRGDKVYSLYYDFRTQKYSSEDYKKAVEWSDSDISKLLPKPNSRVVGVGYDEEDDFSFEAYGVSKEEYESYVEDCKDEGFIENDHQDDYSGYCEYEAENKDGYSISIRYTSDEECMKGEIETRDD